jgi:hypothetical protein
MISHLLYNSYNSCSFTCQAAISAQTCGPIGTQFFADQRPIAGQRKPDWARVGAGRRQHNLHDHIGWQSAAHSGWPNCADHSPLRGQRLADVWLIIMNNEF